jgi:VWFA-related protein
MTVRPARYLAPLILSMLGPVAIPAQQTAPEFKAETHMVLVPVVVRNSKGDVVANLAKEDFQLFADGESRSISSFIMEDTSALVAPDRSLDGNSLSAPVVMVQHFVALMFDDYHFNFSDLAYTRQAALKYLDTLEPADRVAFFSTTGLTYVEFTEDRVKLKAALMGLGAGTSPRLTGLKPGQVAETFNGEFNKLVNRMALLPGQRTVVLISPGMSIGRYNETMSLVDSAVRSRVVISSMDTRGLNLGVVGPDGKAHGTPTSRDWGFQLDVTYGTGGKFIRDTNDMSGAIRQLAATPKYIYVLGFTPDSRPAKNGFHKLAVKLRNGRGLEVQARAGYYDNERDGN